jgi:uncharacterized protein (DUF2267 family)
MTTGLDVFDTTVQESNLWLKDVMERIGTYERHRAYSTLRAVLHALRDRIGPANASHLGAQLPMLLRGLYYEGWRMTGAASKERREIEFLERVTQELRQADLLEVERGVRAVFDVLSKRIERARSLSSSVFSLANCASSGLRRACSSSNPQPKAPAVQTLADSWHQFAIQVPSGVPEHGHDDDKT